MSIQNQHTRIFKFKSVVVLLILFFCGPLFLAQNTLTKFEKEYPFSNIPELEMEAVYTKIIFKVWDKKSIKVHAYLKGDASSKKLEGLLNTWDMQIEASDKVLSIVSKAMPSISNQNVVTQYRISSDIPNQKFTKVMELMLAPLLQNVQNNPIPLPLVKQLTNLQFDFNAYNKLGSTYFKIWEQNMLKKLDEKSKTKMEEWSKSIVPNLVNVSQKTLNKSDSQLPVKKIAVMNYEVSFIEPYKDSSIITVDKVLEITLPKKSRPVFRTRYGSVVVEEELTNVIAELKYTPFRAKRISGPDTKLNIAFAPVIIDYWSEGKLKLGYVKKGELKEVRVIELGMKSSKVQINSLKESGNFENIFSTLSILNFDKNTFLNVNFMVTNSDLLLKLPLVPYNFAYGGRKSYVKILEKNLELNSLGNYENQMLNGFSFSRDTERKIQINAKYSQIFLE